MVAKLYWKGFKEHELVPWWIFSISINVFDKGVFDNNDDEKMKMMAIKRYEGFAIDLAEKLAGILHFNHTFRIVADKKVPTSSSSSRSTSSSPSPSTRPSSSAMCGAWSLVKIYAVNHINPCVSYLLRVCDIP